MPISEAWVTTPVPWVPELWSLLNTAKSAVQLGAALMLNENLAGYCSLPTVPLVVSEDVQSLVNLPSSEVVRECAGSRAREPKSAGMGAIEPFAIALR